MEEDTNFVEFWKDVFSDYSDERRETESSELQVTTSRCYGRGMIRSEMKIPRIPYHLLYTTEIFHRRGRGRAQVLKHKTENVQSSNRPGNLDTSPPLHGSASENAQHFDNDLFVPLQRTSSYCPFVHPRQKDKIPNLRSQDDFPDLVEQVADSKGSSESQQSDVTFRSETRQIDSDYNCTANETDNESSDNHYQIKEYKTGQSNSDVFKTGQSDSGRSKSEDANSDTLEKNPTDSDMHDQMCIQTDQSGTCKTANDEEPLCSSSRQTRPATAKRTKHRIRSRKKGKKSQQASSNSPNSKNTSETSEEVLFPGLPHRTEEWTLKGDNVIQIEGLPSVGDLSNLRGLISSFGETVGVEQLCLGEQCAMRIRYDSADACQWAVSCLHDSDCVFSDARCVLICFHVQPKLM